MKHKTVQVFVLLVVVLALILILLNAFIGTDCEGKVCSAVQTIGIFWVMK